VDKYNNSRFDNEVDILGYAFKPGTNLTVGSPALLLSHQLTERGYMVRLHDPYVDKGLPIEAPSLIVVGCRHEEFRTYEFPKGSVVIDPYRYIPDQQGVTVHRIGEAR
jgi:UDPglucose 6-dehydrogenase